MDFKGLFRKKGLKPGLTLSQASPGLTLIELVIALAVAAVIAGGVLWSLNAADRLALQQTSYALQADLRYTQRMAMIEGRRWGVIFDVVGNRYHIISTEPTTIIQTVTLSHGVQLVETSAPIMLYLPRGTASQGFRCTLAKGRYWQRLTGTVSGGRIEIKDIITTIDGDIPIYD
jgi:prepilin-type N-terminal cleavage/methylation domain-containing protein